MAQGNNPVDKGMLLWPTFGMEMTDIIQRGGGVSRLSKELRLHHATVLGWRRVPAHHARRVSEITGIPLHELRSDLWDAPSEAAATDAAA